MRDSVKTDADYARAAVKCLSGTHGDIYAVSGNMVGMVHLKYAASPENELGPRGAFVEVDSYVKDSGTSVDGYATAPLPFHMSGEDWFKLPPQLRDKYNCYPSETGLRLICSGRIRLDNDASCQQLAAAVDWALRKARMDLLGVSRDMGWDEPSRFKKFAKGARK